MYGSAKRFGSPVGEEMLVSQTNSSEVPRWMQLSTSLDSSSGPLALRALIDSGVEDNLLDVVVAKQPNLDLKSLEEPIYVRVLNGKLLDRVTHQTGPLQLLLSGNHRTYYFQNYALTCCTYSLRFSVAKIS